MNVLKLVAFSHNGHGGILQVWHFAMKCQVMRSERASQSAARRGIYLSSQAEI